MKRPPLRTGRNKHLTRADKEEAETVPCVWYSCDEAHRQIMSAARPCCNSLVAIVAKPDASAGANRRGSKPMSPG